MSHDKTMSKLLGREKIKKLNIDLMDKTDEDFREARLEYVKRKIQYHDKTREWAEADFDQKYPNKQTWNAQQGPTLNALGEQQIVDKINELIEEINKI